MITKKDMGLKSIKIALLTVAGLSKLGGGKLKELDVIDYIKKPFDFDDLLRRVDKMLGS